MIEVEKYNKLTHEIIGCAMRVHTALGNGFQEVIYQRALAIEFESNKINFTREEEKNIYYKDQYIGTRRVDFLINNEVLLELKAITKVEDVHHAQIINYLEAYKLPIGLLINFGTKKLEFKRFVKTIK